MADTKQDIVARQLQARIDRFEAEKAELKSQINRFEVELEDLPDDLKAEIEEDKDRYLCLFNDHKRLKTERAELIEALQKLLGQFEKWEGYHQWDEEDEDALQSGRTVLAKADLPVIRQRNPASDETTNPKPEVK